MSFPRYPRYKDSGVEWLGKVPEHWVLRRLGCYFDERREKVSDRDYPALSVTKNGIVPQLETAAKTDDGDNRKRVCAGDFVINSRSDRKGSAGVADIEGSVSLICTVLSPRSDVLSAFVHHLLRSVPFQEEFYRYGKGIVADLWSTNYGEMRNILLAVPTRPEQAAIATFLDRETAKIDALIFEQQRLIELLQEKRQAVISHAVTKGLNPDAPMKASGIEWLGEVPGHWEVTRLDRVSGFVNGKAHEPFVHDDGQFICVTSRFISTDGESKRMCTENLTPARRDDVLMVMSDLPSGRALARTYHVQDDRAYAINQRVCAIRPEGATSRYLSYLLDRNPWFLRNDDGLNQTHLSIADFRKMPLVLPPTEEQQTISRYLDGVVDLSARLVGHAEACVGVLQERRSALISAAVTGRIDVRGLTSSEAA